MTSVDNTTPFTVEANPGTDIWRKPGHNAWNIPNIHTCTGPLKDFLSVRVTFTAPWAHSYDQSGVLLVPRLASEAAPPNSKWIKTGIELYDGQPHLSDDEDDKSVTIEVFRDGGPQGKNAWVHHLLLDKDGNIKNRIPLRKICWIFADENEGDWVLDVSPLAARPDKDAKDGLKVEFAKFKVQWSQ
ncbi:uncharacterized protein N0V96_000184 [Colletotrichum fioriniae]|uniref:uncharacterized protein n=1 Tax=Colletotrichum fioriniae TaxID=710243 RepID=UPI0032D9E982|nr:hypothetical protein N0V96_000184 [Colletotrichum fioriniae]